MPKKFKFKIENVMYEWDKQFITGLEVRHVGPGIPDSMDLYLKVKGKPGRLVANDERIDLEDPGVEKFYSQESSSSAGRD
ncbi:MAG: multiubiquitin domain-containing protein [Deltaproteobacteria bacterium]